MLISAFFPNPKPPLWERVRHVAGTSGPKWFGFRDDWNLVNRFQARYRLARCCKGLQLKGYTSGTARGYSALACTFLFWSVFDMYVRLAKISDRAALMDKHGARAVLEEITCIDGYERFFTGVLENLEHPQYAAAVQAFLSGKRCQPSRVLVAVRHAFVHGALTPNANKIDPERCIEICRLIARFVLRVVDEECKEKISAGLEQWEREHGAL